MGIFDMDINLSIKNITVTKILNVSHYDNKA
jgi:hypothetical protein